MVDDLTVAQVAELTAGLKRSQGELERALEVGEEGVEAVSLEQPIGRVSRVDAIQQQKMAEASRRQQVLRLGQIRVALAAAQSGTYGVCRSSEEPVGYPGLEARPEALSCLSCQGGRERE